MYRVFPHDVTAAILVSLTNPTGDELFSYANAFFWSNKLAYRSWSNRRPFSIKRLLSIKLHLELFILYKTPLSN